MTKPDIFAFGRPQWRIIEFERNGKTYRQTQSIILGFYVNIGEPYLDRVWYGTTYFKMKENTIADLNEEFEPFFGFKKNKRVVNVGS